MFNPTPAPQGVRTALFKEVERRRGLYQERDIVMHNIRRYRLMRQKTYMPKAYARRLGGSKGVKLPTMYRLVQTAVAAVAKRFPTVYVEPFSIGDRKAAAEMTRAASLLLQSINTAAARPYLYGLYFTLFGDGMGVTKTQPGAWAGFPLPPSENYDPDEYNLRVIEFLRDHPLPFVSRVVDPLTCYPPLDEYGGGVFVESGWRATTEVMKSIGIRPSKDGLGFARNEQDQIPEGKPYPELELPPGFPPTVRVDELWDDDRVAISINGHDTVWMFENPIGKKPYTWGYADPTGVEDPTNVGMSVAFPLYYLAPWIDTLVGVMTAWSLFAAPTPYTTRDPIPGQPPTKEMTITNYEPGKMYNFPTGVTPGVLSPPDVGAAVTSHLNFLVEAADRGGLPALVSGAGVGTRLPALTFQAAFEAATDRLAPAAQSAEAIIAGTLHKAFRLIGRYNTPVKVNGWEYGSAEGERKKRGWATIKPVEARKDRQVVVSLAIDSTQDLIAKGTHAQFMVNAGLWKEDRGMRFGGVDNPEEEKEGIDADTARRAMRPLLAQTVIMEDPGMRELIESQMGEEETGEPAGPGRNREGVPPGRGGGKRGGPTQRPRGRRGGK